jgi:CRP-like cAMP-binding protein
VPQTRAVNPERTANSLLAALPRKGYELLRPRLEPVELQFGDLLYHPREAIQHVYFPVDCMVSLLTLADGHLALEVGLVGHEGMLGIPLVLGVMDSPVRALVQGAGMALRMKSAPFLAEFGRNPPLQRAAYRYAYDLMVQVTQTAACNRFHNVDARLARWLLMTRERVRSDRFRLTQEMLGNMLGVLRVAVTKAAGMLQKQGLIGYSRGEIRILDREALEAVACACYQIVKLAPAAMRAQPTLVR